VEANLDSKRRYHRAKLGGVLVAAFRYLVAKYGYHPHKADGMPLMMNASKRCESKPECL
jgi:hypothetical protein